jgi:hypothetical protein
MGGWLPSESPAGISRNARLECVGIRTWATRCRRLVKDYERYAETLAGFHVIAFVGYMLKHAADLMKGA